jgi:hypothetical protein
VGLVSGLALMLSPQGAGAAPAVPAAPASPSGGSVLFVGDSNALSIFAAVADAPGAGWSVAIATRFGCGVVPYTAIADGVVLRPQQPLCRNWERARRSEVRAQPAEIGLLFVGGWEQYDRWRAGSTLPFTSKRWLRATAKDYAQVLSEMRDSVDRVGIVLNGCHQVPETELPVEVMFQWGRYAPVINDERRIEATNAAARRAAANVGFRVEIYDLRNFLCHDGYRDAKRGVVLRTDGLHFTAEGSQLIWKWLKRKIAER